jgi:hypothetical protein
MGSFASRLSAKHMSIGYDPKTLRLIDSIH